MTNNWQPSRKRGSAQGKSFKSILLMFAVTMVLLLVIISFFWGDSGFIKMYFLHKKIELAEQDIHLLKVRQSDLLWEKDKIENDPEYIQRFAIEKHGYAKPEQKIIQFVQKDSTGKSDVQQLSSESRKQ